MRLNDFNKVNSVREKANGEKMSHEEYYGNVVNGIGLNTLVQLLPATREQLKRSIRLHGNLSGIKLQVWDNAVPQLKYYIHRIGVKSLSLCEGVCILKQTAIMYLQEEEKREKEEKEELERIVKSCPIWL
ncbi:hypothetical protein PQE72_gp031 [Bacillus phage vB_BanS_Skywalker]|uniref:Uncharacterized protein n=2 Tax=Tsamsavirus TaxID=3044849 RepID=A0AAE8YVN0_9CAUD|nr:hypothetical protein PQE72_gp031 [Bacillus phage vB_BanS_Skywalker]YP_010680899.1 hypothetical protein PQE73_gp003 [Bacillus phage vB_BanS_MrDarsey]UGO47835.1 hypothetical protein MRDARSEY_3 [Bacillus phage vB_BanS_MrDarsey]UGO51412.1 hypothetical protein SKYWALKER_255 [Bacillus phage vB_BanS_Skywalker]